MLDGRDFLEAEIILFDDVTLRPLLRALHHQLFRAAGDCAR
jgi:hypothetical protein